MNFLDVRTDYAFKKIFGSIESKKILISFLNAIVYSNSKKSIKDLTITDPYNIPMIKGVKDTFVELPKFKKEIDELEDIKDEWIYFIKNAGSLEYIPKDLDNCIKLALENANEANLTKDELEAQHKRKEFISIQKLALLKAKEDGLEMGFEKGIEQGIEQGREEGIIQTAIAMIEEFNLPTEVVSKKLDIPIEELRGYL